MNHVTFVHVNSPLSEATWGKSSLFPPKRNCFLYNHFWFSFSSSQILSCPVTARQTTHRFTPSPHLRTMCSSEYQQTVPTAHAAHVRLHQPGRAEWANSVSGQPVFCWESCSQPHHPRVRFILLNPPIPSLGRGTLEKNRFAHNCWVSHL